MSSSRSVVTSTMTQSSTSRVDKKLKRRSRDHINSSVGKKFKTDSKRKSISKSSFVADDHNDSENVSQDHDDGHMRLLNEFRANRSLNHDIKFDPRRVRILKLGRSRTAVVNDDTLNGDVDGGVVYWMSRDSRVQDNWAMIYAQRLAIERQVPLHVCFCLTSSFLNASLRQFDFLLEGLKSVQRECHELNIGFHVLDGSGDLTLNDWVQTNNISAVVCDFNPLRVVRDWVATVKSQLAPHVFFAQVDAHNIVPCWQASLKQEVYASTFRPKVLNQLDRFLTEFPSVIVHPYGKNRTAADIDWKYLLQSRDANKSVLPVKWAVPGYDHAVKSLYIFIQDNLSKYASLRNNPTTTVISNLSPWFHFGQISVQRVVLKILSLKPSHPDSVDRYIDEVVVRRELADNFCFYNDRYDCVEGAPQWAQETIEQHKYDHRSYIYNLTELASCQTHDELWNSAQAQLRCEGKMHGYMRMYWAKKIMEWTPSADMALGYAIFLNDHYSVDGRDPNGYVGCMWSICGVHDRPFKERKIFGRIRYMNYAGCKRKFNVDLYIAKYKIKNSQQECVIV